MCFFVCVYRFHLAAGGHLLHMPSHIDMWLGKYECAMETNIRAVEADEKYVAVTGELEGAACITEGAARVRAIDAEFVCLPLCVDSVLLRVLN